MKETIFLHNELRNLNDLKLKLKYFNTLIHILKCKADRYI